MKENRLLGVFRNMGSKGMVAVLVSALSIGAVAGGAYALTSGSGSSSGPAANSKASLGTATTSPGGSTVPTQAPAQGPSARARGLGKGLRRRCGNAARAGSAGSSGPAGSGASGNPGNPGNSGNSGSSGGSGGSGGSGSSSPGAACKKAALRLRKAIMSRIAKLLRSAVSAQITMHTKNGDKVIDLDRGKIASLSAGSITLQRADGVTVTASISQSTREPGRQNLSVGSQVILVEVSGQAKWIVPLGQLEKRTRPTASGAGGSKGSSQLSAGAVAAGGGLLETVA